MRFDEHFYIDNAAVLLPDADVETNAADICPQGIPIKKSIKTRKNPLTNRALIAIIRKLSDSEPNMGV